MLAEQIDASIERLKMSVTVENAQTLKNDLDTLYNKLLAYKTQVETFMKNSVETKKLLGEVSEEKETIVSTLKRFCNDALDGKRDLALQDLQDLNTYLEAGNRDLEKIWLDYRNYNYIASRNLINALINVLDDEDQLEKLGQLKNSIENKSIGDSQTIKDIKKFRELTDKVIESHGMKPEIQDFLKKLASGEEVMLYEITEDIFKWMKDNKLDRKVFLSLNS